ncbi:MAG: hypothetical protein ACK4OK_09585 [Thermoflexus sp.]
MDWLDRLQKRFRAALEELEYELGRLPNEQEFVRFLREFDRGLLDDLNWLAMALEPPEARKRLYPFRKAGEPILRKPTRKLIRRLLREERKARG